jgi:hypothetical protein
MKVIHRFILLVSLLITFHPPLTSSPAHQLTNSPTDQPDLWARVDSLTALGQPRSALQLVEQIYQSAKARGDDQQLVKAILYRVKLNADFQENVLTMVIRDLQKEIGMANAPTQQLLRSVLAEVYWKYYQNNQYRFRDRTQIRQNMSDSLETWDLSTIYRAILKNYLLSVSEAELLKNTPITSYAAVVSCEPFGEKKTEKELELAMKFKPTLYDFLAGRALEFLTAGVSERIVPVGKFEVDQIWYTSQPFQFTRNRMMIPADSASPASFALTLFRDLATFHYSDKDPCALIGFELQRFAFVRQESTLPGRDSLYLDALITFEKSQAASPWSTSVSFAIAQWLNEQGQRYQPLVSDRYKWDNKSALTVCEGAIKRFPDSEGARNCKILASSIALPSLQITTEKAVPSGKPSLAMVEYKNITSLYLRIVSVDPDRFAEKTGSSDAADMNRFLAGLTPVHAWSQSLPSDGDLQPHSVEAKLPANTTGFFVLLASTSEKFTGDKQVFAYAPFWSTRISYISTREADGSMTYAVVDRVTGAPLKGATAQIWMRNWDYRERRYSTTQTGEQVTDEHGLINIKTPEDQRRQSNVFLKITYKDDRFVSGDYYLYPVPKQQERSYLQTRFFTDRAIYRPGQIVYFKGIITERRGESTAIKPNHATRLVFTDVNGQKIAEKNLTSNEFGSVNGSFVIPGGLLQGLMTISNESGSVQIAVEEYKIPTFDVVFDTLEGNYRLDEPVTVTGTARAYAGNAIDGGVVNYRVVRTARFPFFDRFGYWPIPVSSEMEIANGTIRTDTDGKYRLSFKATGDPTVDRSYKPVFNFTVYVDVTDVNGEMQSAMTTLSAGTVSLLLSATVPEKVNIDSAGRIRISATNLNGRATPVKVTAVLKKLKQPDRLLKPRAWSRPDLNLMMKEEFVATFPDYPYGNETDPATWPVEKTLFSGVIDLASDSGIRDPGSRILDPGSWMLELTAVDPFGDTVVFRKNFTAFSPTAKEITVNTIDWFIPLKTSGEPGESALFLAGSRAENVTLMYEVIRRDSVVSRDWIRIYNRASLIQIPIREHFRGNFAVNFVFVKENRVFQHNQVVTVPYANKKLSIGIESFRGNVEPGSRETWKIRITDAAGKPVKAEFLAGMYDAALDAFRSNEWHFDIYQRFSGIRPWSGDQAFSLSQAVVRIPGGLGDGFSFHPELQLNWFGFSYFYGYRGSRVMAMAGMTATESDAAYTKTEQKEREAPPSMDGAKGENTMMDDTVITSETSPEPKATPVVPVRRDFRETAFFYPSMVTDSTGILSLQFTLPGSLTRWKMSGLAHTRSLDYALIEKELVTRRDLMVFPNAPRFVRQGDTVIFTTRIVNISGKELAGTVSIGLTDPLTQQPVNQLVDAGWPGTKRSESVYTRDFALSAGKSDTVSWRLFIPSDPSLTVLQYRISATAGDFTDAEEKAFPVFSNRMLVTESLPLPVRGKGTFDFTFDKLLVSSKDNGTLKNYRLTLEFASNPAWYAIQALPSLNEHPGETADALFAAYWANSVASHIIHSDPSIRTVFEAWKQLTPDALRSNLFKNEDLKSALISETPWVMEAISETERKQKLGQYFDPDMIAQNLTENLAKLQKLQTPGGGWTWMAGMPDNRFITQEIVMGLGKLHHLGISDLSRDPILREMVSRAVRYLDRELLEDYQRILKYDAARVNDNHLGNLQVQYLYARSFFTAAAGIPTPEPAASEALAYFTGQAEKYWLKQDLYSQAMIVLALSRTGNQTIPALILKSLAEKALHSDELGMYWASEGGYYWYQAPIERQALMIEAFDEAGKNETVVEDLKVWLLKQKQTQSWRSPRATLEACYALLLRGTGLLTTPGQTDPGVVITLGNKKINTASLTDVSKEAGTGYFRMSWQGSEITPAMGNISLTKRSDGVAWGAVYWQYFEDLDRITPAATPLKLEKELFIQRNTPTGPILDPLPDSPDRQAGTSLKVGDKLTVRIVLSVDRDLEFVHMKDLRAASLEPYQQPVSGTMPPLSGYRYQDGLGYYQSTTDVATNFFFDYLPKGTYVFEYGLKVNAAGEYSNGITTIQCLYAPEFSAHSQGIRIGIH